jgi:hypothetical protein
MPSSLYPSVSRLSWLGKHNTPYGLRPCIFSKVLDSLKILILQNEALQTAEAVQLIALKAVLRCASLQVSVQTIKSRFVGVARKLANRITDETMALGF